jgi:hypothetical protein
VDAVVDWTAITGAATAAGSVVGAGALIVAALTLISEGRRWRADRLREEEERHAAEQGMASFVSAVTESTDEDTVTVVAVNDGDRPAFNVRVTSEHGAALISRSDGGSPDDAIRRLNPGQRVSFTFQTLPGEAEFSRPIIDFYDVEGRRWLRRGFGPPQRRTGWWDETSSSVPH